MIPNSRRLWRFAYSIIKDAAPFVAIATWVFLIFWCLMWPTHGYVRHNDEWTPYGCWGWASCGVLFAPLAIYYAWLWIPEIVHSLLVIPCRYVGKRWRESTVDNAPTEPVDTLVRSSQQPGNQLLRGTGIDFGVTRKV